MFAAINTVACVLVVAVAFPHGDATQHHNRTLVKAPVITVKPSGSDATCRRGSLSKPCATLARAYSLARCGDIAEVAAGSYGNQNLIETSAGSACRRNPIVLRAASGTRPTIRWISFGLWRGGALSDAPDNLILRGFEVRWGISMWGDVANVTLDDIDGGSFFIGGGGTNITVKNSDWGPCTPSGRFQGEPADCRNYFPGDGRSGQVRIIGGTNLLFENNDFHDMVIDLPGAHWECIFMNADGLRNVTFRGNRFSNCQTNAIALGNNRNPNNVAGTWLIENNWFGSCPGGTAGGNGPYCLNLTSLPVAAKIIVRFNSFAPGEYLGCEAGCGDPQGRLNVDGNIFGSGAACIRGGQYRDNLFLSHRSGCGEIARSSVFGYDYRNGRLVIEPRAADGVKTAFAEAGRREVRSLRTIARKLSKQRMLAPAGGWSPASVRAILTDNVYLGRRLGIQARHPRLITPSKWRRAQRALVATRG